MLCRLVFWFALIYFTTYFLGTNELNTEQKLYSIEHLLLICIFFHLMGTKFPVRSKASSICCFNIIHKLTHSLYTTRVLFTQLLYSSLCWVHTFSNIKTIVSFDWLTACFCMCYTEWGFTLRCSIVRELLLLPPFLFALNIRGWCYMYNTEWLARCVYTGNI